MGCLDLVDWNDGIERWNGMEWNVESNGVLGTCANRIHHASFIVPGLMPMVNQRVAVIYQTLYDNVIEALNWFVVLYHQLLGYCQGED